MATLREENTRLQERVDYLERELDALRIETQRLEMPLTYNARFVIDQLTEERNFLRLIVQQIASPMLVVTPKETQHG